jgi:hypothetical protein
MPSKPWWTAQFNFSLKLAANNNALGFVYLAAQFGFWYSYSETAVRIITKNPISFSSCFHRSEFLTGLCCWVVCIHSGSSSSSTLCCWVVCILSGRRGSSSLCCWVVCILRGSSSSPGPEDRVWEKEKIGFATWITGRGKWLGGIQYLGKRYKEAM